MPVKTLHKILSFLIATVWIANGLFCKVLNLVPRHQEIIGRILGNEYAGLFTKIIGSSEILMAVWIISGIKTRLNAMTQISIVAIMNVIEFLLVPDLLLWGKANSMFALLFILVTYYNEFVLRKKLAYKTNTSQ